MRNSSDYHVTESSWIRHFIPDGNGYPNQSDASLQNGSEGVRVTGIQTCGLAKTSLHPIGGTAGNSFCQACYWNVNSWIYIYLYLWMVFQWLFSHTLIGSLILNYTFTSSLEHKEMDLNLVFCMRSLFEKSLWSFKFAEFALSGDLSSSNMGNMKIGVCYSLWTHKSCKSLSFISVLGGHEKDDRVFWNFFYNYIGTYNI